MERELRDGVASHHALPGVASDPVDFDKVFVGLGHGVFPLFGDHALHDKHERGIHRGDSLLKTNIATSSKKQPHPTMNIPRPEYPRPQFARPDWLCLNGEWQFEIDKSDTGFERGLLERELKDKIVVPFCPESKLSGIEETDFLNAVWYRREVTIPFEWAGRQPVLHFQAVDYDTTVWVNGKQVVKHRGGFTPFSCNLDGLVEAGETFTLVVRARDSHVHPQPRGKQSQKYGNYGCFYTRTTGIWQTVWMEPVEKYHLRRARITPDVTHGLFRLEQPLSKAKPGLLLRVNLRDDRGVLCTARCAADLDLAPTLTLPIPEDRRRLWSPEDPFLYDIDIELIDDEGNRLDRVETYAGLRSISIHGPAVKINGKTIFQRLVLDQGYYPDGIMTAPNDEALKNDIVLSMQAGFNGARLHQKVFEERFLYHADKMGYLVWGEFPDWGCSGYGSPDDHQKPSPSYVSEWLEALERDYSHPSIIGWCPLNETYQSLTEKTTVLDEITLAMFLATKAMDTTRPVLDVSGYSHRVSATDVFDCHDYEQNPLRFKLKHAGLAKGIPYLNKAECMPTCGAPAETAWSIDYQGQPFFVSEFGGIWWNPDAKAGEDSWGYGDRPRSLAEFYDRFEGLCNALLDEELMFGYCYTQLTDTYQEQNGLYTFDRRPKFDFEKLRKVQERVAAIEKVAEKQEKKRALFREMRDLEDIASVELKRA